MRMTSRLHGRVGPMALARRLIAFVMIRRSPRATFGRIVIGDLLADEGSESRIQTVRDALELAASAFPRGYGMAQRYLRRILVVGGGGQVYAATIRACVLDAGFIERENLAVIVGLICHEAMHARVDQAGIQYSRANRPRIEKLCVALQADALIAAGDEAAARRATGSLSAPWWTDEARMGRRSEQLRAHGIPEVLVGLHERFQRYFVGHRNT
jgi:hypothetical protein